MPLPHVARRGDEGGSAFTADAERTSGIGREPSVTTQTLRAVEPARRVGAVIGAGGEREARERQARVLISEEAARWRAECRLATPTRRDSARRTSSAYGRSLLVGCSRARATLRTSS